MPVAPKGGKSTATIRISPFRLYVRPSKGGFICEFSGTDSRGRRIEIELDFPKWWAAEIASKLEILTRGVKR